MDKIPEQSTMTKGESTSSSSNDECQDLRDAPEVSTELGELEQQGKRPMFRLRPEDDEEPQDWWFCSTAIPLLAATSGPLANVLSIAALVTSWRNRYDTANPGVDADSIGFPDPKWCLGLNGASLACGFIGNIFLLFNFTRRVRYIIALPMTIILWYFATGILIAITVSMNEYVPPKPVIEVYSQGYWHAVIAAVLYMFSSMILMLNMLGYFLGHYPQHFELTDEQRNLILQTMMFFIWLAGGGAVFAKVEGWAFVDALYFCDVTILTVGFGDFHPINDGGRGLVFPYSVGGIIILGLMVSSIHKFAKELGTSHVIQRHVEKRRTWTLSRSVTSDDEFEQRKLQLRLQDSTQKGGQISTAFQSRTPTVNFDTSKREPEPPIPGPTKRHTLIIGVKKLAKVPRVGTRKPKILMLREERDRFDQMRAIQKSTNDFKRYSALTMSVIAFGILWCVGAIGFWKAEAETQHLSYFQALYFCYVSLLTIGYGDLSPTSNAGKPFFIVWSLIAVPTMTILISDMGETVIASFKHGTFVLADWTVLPKAGVWRAFVEKHPRLLRWLQNKEDERKQERRLQEGFRTGPADEDMDNNNNPLLPPTLEDIAQLDTLDDGALARRLALAIRRTANDLRADPPRRYSYEEWAEYTRLIRFSRMDPEQLEEAEEDSGLVEWDWIGKESPMMAQVSESEWLLDRLCESLNRYMRKLKLGGDQGMPMPRSNGTAEAEFVEAGDEGKGGGEEEIRKKGV